MTREKLCASWAVYLDQMSLLVVRFASQAPDKNRCALPALPVEGVGSYVAHDRRLEVLAKDVQHGVKDEERHVGAQEVMRSFVRRKERQQILLLVAADIGMLIVHEDARGSLGAGLCFALFKYKLNEAENIILLPKGRLVNIRRREHRQVAHQGGEPFRLSAFGLVLLESGF